MEKPPLILSSSFQVVSGKTNKQNPQNTQTKTPHVSGSGLSIVATPKIPFAEMQASHSMPFQ